MPITPQYGYKADPNNLNAVIRDTAIPISSLTFQQTPLNVQSPTPAPVPDIKNIPITTPPVPPVSPTSTVPTGSDFNKTIEDLTIKFLGKPGAEAKAITGKTAGFEQSLNELNTQIKMHQANALARQEEALKQGETLRYSTGLAGQVARTDDIEAMKLSALAQGMQGNILLAEKQAKSAIETEFSQVAQDIQNARKNLLDNYDTFTAAEKKRADATLLSLNEKDAFVARQTSDREQSYKIAIEAAKNGLTDTKLLTQIQNSNPEEAANLASPYLAKKEKMTFDTFERMVNGEKHTIRQVLDPTGKVVSETDLGAKGVNLSSDEKALQYDKIKQRATELFDDGATEENYKQMREELVDGGLGGYLDDFDKFAKPLLPQKPISIEKVKTEIVKTLQPQKEVLSREEAKVAAENQLFEALGLKKEQTLPQAYQEVIENSLDEVYGKKKSWWKFW